MPVFCTMLAMRQSGLVSSDMAHAFDTSFGHMLLRNPVTFNAMNYVLKTDENTKKSRCM